MSTPAQNIINVIDAYSQAAKGKPAAKPQVSSAGDDFASLVKGAIQEAKTISERSEQLSIAGVTDRADISQVVTAVAEAEVALQTVVAVRDKVIDAYKDIIRMPM